MARSGRGTRIGGYRAGERGSETEEASAGPEKGSSIRAARTAIKGSFHQRLLGGIIIVCGAADTRLCAYRNSRHNMSGVRFGDKEAREWGESIRRNAGGTGGQNARGTILMGERRR